MGHSRSSVRVRTFAGCGLQAVVRIASLLTCVNILAVLAVTVTRVGHTNQEAHADLFAAYAHILPGQHVEVAALEAEGFSCKDDSRPTPADLAQLCSNGEGNRQVSAITIAVWDGIVERLDLNPRDRAFVVGDLVLLWGKPEIQQIGPWLSLRWRGRHISASAWSASGQFSNFQPVLQLSFGL
jgi:hypothetical protein